MTITPTPVTLAQITESLLRFRDYGHWMYHTEEGIKGFERFEVTHQGRVFSLTVPEDGKVVLTLKDDGTRIVFDPIIITAPRQGLALDHIQYRVAIVNKSELSEQNATFANEVAIFVVSYFQRLAAFTFFMRMADETVASIAADLAKVK